MVHLLFLLWGGFYILIFRFGYNIHNMWPVWVWNAVLFILWSGYDFASGNARMSMFELIVAVLQALIAWFSWKNDRNRRNRKKFRLGALGYKARAARDRLVAAMPQGRKPGLNPT